MASKKSWLDLTDEKLISRLHAQVKDTEEECVRVINRADDNTRFAVPSGDHWDEDDRKIADDSGVAAVTVNQTYVIVASLSGRESTTRYAPRVRGRAVDDDGFAEVFDQTIRYIRQKEDQEIKESSAFHWSLIHNLSWVAASVSLEGALPEHQFERCVLSEMRWDTTAREINLMDRKWHQRGRWFSRSQFAVRWPDIFEDLDAKDYFEDDSHGDMSGHGAVTSDAPSSNIPWANARKGRAYSSRKDEIFVQEAEWREWECYYELAVPAGVTTPDLPGEEMADVLWQDKIMESEMLAQVAMQSQAMGQPMPERPTEAVELSEPEYKRFEERYEELALGNDMDLPEYWEESLRLQREAWRFALVCGDRLLDSGTRQERMPIMHCMTCVIEEYMDRTELSGPVDLVKGPNRLTSRLYSLYIEGVALESKGGIAVKGMSNVAELEERYAKTGAVLDLGDNGEIQQLPRGNTSNIERAMDRMSQIASQVAAVSPYQTGQVQNLSRTSTTAVESVQAAANTIWTQPFDALRLFRRTITRLQLAQVAAYWDTEDVAQVVANRLLQFIPPQSEWDRVRGLDVVVDEAPATATARQQLLIDIGNQGLLEMMTNLGYPPPPETMVSLLNLPADMQQEWLKSIQETVAAQQAAAQQQQQPGAEEPPQQ